VVWNDECKLVPSVKIDKELHDEHDEHAVHFGIFDHDLLVASSRCCIHEHVADLPESQFYSQLKVPSPIATMNRLVVRRAYRNRGYARTLDEVRIRWAIGKGANSIIVCGQPRRSKSLTELGFTTTDLQGKSYFYDDGRFIVHYRVINNPAQYRNADTCQVL
jgi:GNAT superfamily N-acetyltransferase